LFSRSSKAGRDLRHLYLCKNKLFFSLFHCSLLHYFFTKEQEPSAPTPIPWIHSRTCPWNWNHQKTPGTPDLLGTSHFSTIEKSSPDPLDSIDWTSPLLQAAARFQQTGLNKSNYATSTNSFNSWKRPTGIRNRTPEPPCPVSDVKY
jgi:hypothetical protein